MKKLSVLFLSALLAAACAVPAHAADVEALTGTPKIDGVLDEIYTQSAKVVNDGDPFYTWGDDLQKGTSSATTYFLHDDKYLYICTVIHDETITETELPNTWQADGAEHWFIWNDGSKQNVSRDAFDKFLYGGAVLKTGIATEDNCKYKSTIDGNNYTVEIAVPLELLEINNKTISFSEQFNDVFTEDGANGIAYGSQAADQVLALSDKAVVVKEEKKEDTTGASADTADMGLVLSAVAMGASALVIFKKKH